MINQSNTHWIFVCGMNSEKDDQSRHVYDIFFALSILKRKGVSHNNISVLVEPDPNHLLANLPDPLPFDGVTVMEVAEFQTVINSKTSENIVLTILGHGSPQGIDANSLLKPHDLINTIHLKNELKKCVVIFGQCYSGIYNYTNLIKEFNNGDDKPIISFIGASNLNSSLSSPVSVTLHSYPLSWVANIFVCFFFLWINNNQIQRDIDGDSKDTLSDAYKYAGAYTSSFLLNEKAKISLEIYQLQQQMYEKEKSINTVLPDVNLQMEIDGLRKTITNKAMINHNIQDPWILNANKAREIEFDL